MFGYLRHLANFAHIVDAGSITGAANKLDVSPSTMSESVKILESHFNEPLLERRKTGVFPTSKGALIYEDCQQIVSSYDRVVQSNSEQLTGAVKVSIPSECLVNLGSKLVQELAEKAPDIRLVLAAENEVLDHTKFARDLYVRIAKDKDHQKLTTLHTNQERVVLVASSLLISRSNYKSKETISKLTYLAGMDGNVPQVLKLKDPSEFITFQNTIQIGSTDARIALMRQGLGITACLLSTVQEEIDKGSLIWLLPDNFGFDLFMTIGSPHRKPNAASKLVAQVLANAHCHT